MYALAAMLTAAVAAAYFGPRQCSEIYGCVGGLTTGWAWVLVAVSGAAVGLLVAAAIDLALNVPYLLANRAEAKRRRGLDVD